MGNKEHNGTTEAEEATTNEANMQICKQANITQHSRAKAGPQAYLESVA
jgi:hypothetical protein